MINQEYANRDLFRHLEEVVPSDLPVPRIEVTRFWRRKNGFDTRETVAWSVKAIGLNEQPIPKEDEVVSERDAEHIADQWAALLGWPIVRLRRVVQSQSITELDL